MGWPFRRFLGKAGFGQCDSLIDLSLIRAPVGLRLPGCPVRGGVAPERAAGHVPDAENLGVDEEFVAGVLAGEEELKEVHVGELEDLFLLVRDVVGEDAGSREPVVPVVDAAGAKRARAAAAAAAANEEGGAVAPEFGAVVVRGVSEVSDDGMMGIDLDGDNIPDVSMAGMVSGRPGVGWKDEQDKRRVSLRNARALAVMTMFRLGMTYEEQVAALGLVSQIELALISYFRESVPEPGQSWDPHRRAREIERRLARLRWVEGEQQKERSGVRGMWNWLIGKPPLTGKMLYDKMIEHADGMLAAMNEERYSKDIMSDVMRFTGSVPDDDDRPALPG